MNFIADLNLVRKFQHSSSEEFLHRQFFTVEEREPFVFLISFRPFGHLAILDVIFYYLIQAPTLPIPDGLWAYPKYFLFHLCYH